MAKGTTGPSDRQIDEQRRRSLPPRQLGLRRPANWPRYMVAKRMGDGSIAYYWNAKSADIKAGFYDPAGSSPQKLRLGDRARRPSQHASGRVALWARRGQSVGHTSRL